MMITKEFGAITAMKILMMIGNDILVLIIGNNDGYDDLDDLAMMKIYMKVL